MSTYIIQFIEVMLAMFLADVCWAYYFIKIDERRSVAAGAWAVLIYMFGAFTVTSYISDKSLIIAAMIGSFLGTFCTVEYKKRNEAKDKNLEKPHSKSQKGCDHEKWDMDTQIKVIQCQKCGKRAWVDQVKSLF